MTRAPQELRFFTTESPAEDGLTHPLVKERRAWAQATRSKTAVVCEPDQASREIDRRRGVEGVREQRPALRLPERLYLCVGRLGRGNLDAVGNEVAMAPCDVHDVYDTEALVEDLWG